MPVNYRVYPEQSLVYVRCFGEVTVEQSLTSFRQYTQDPEYAEGQSQLIDLTDVTKYERNFAEIISLQAHLAEAFVSTQLPSVSPSYMIYVAPTEMTQAMAMASLRSWKNLPSIIPLVVQNLDEALEILSLGISLQEARLLLTS